MVYKFEKIPQERSDKMESVAKAVEKAIEMPVSYRLSKQGSREFLDIQTPFGFETSVDVALVTSLNGKPLDVDHHLFLNALILACKLSVDERVKSRDYVKNGTPHYEGLLEIPEIDSDLLEEREG